MVEEKSDRWWSPSQSINRCCFRTHIGTLLSPFKATSDPPTTTGTQSTTKHFLPPPTPPPSAPYRPQAFLPRSPHTLRRALATKKQSPSSNHRTSPAKPTPQLLKNMDTSTQTNSTPYSPSGTRQVQVSQTQPSRRKQANTRRSSFSSSSGSASGMLEPFIYDTSSVVDRLYMGNARGAPTVTLETLNKICGPLTPGQ